ncbi:MAG: TonB-dependent receptor [Fimbriimonadaceae bacterium]|nr:TonB-dependent receptor [Chitinophagales bacterium]
MQNLFRYSMITFMLSINIKTITAQNSLSGTITDAASGNALPGASVYFPDLRSGAITDAEGRYTIQDLPSKKLLVQITFIGYASVSEVIDITVTAEKDFQLKESVTEINEIVVTGLSQSAEANRTATPVSIVSKTTLLQNASANIIDALATQPGITQITTGPAISKPEIRGLGYNRVVVINDGIKQEGQQWGDEHGIEIDEFSVNRIEILKGPASIAYGSDAMAGVIHFISAPTLPQGIIKANLLANYQTNNGLIGYSGNIAGNIKGFIWDARYSGKYAHAYQNKIDGYVYGSSFNEQSANGIIGLNKKWGFSHLHAGYYALNVGLIEGERDSATGQFIQPVIISDSLIGETIVSDSDLKSYAVNLPKQNIKHYKAVLNNSFVLGEGALNIIAGFQQNNRQEFEDILNPEAYALYFKMNTTNYDVRYLFPEKNNWQSSLGINGMLQNSKNLGEEVLIPEYDLFDIGVFATAKKTINKLDIAAGLRYDSRNINSASFYSEEEGENIFEAFNTNFSAFSGSIGATYQFTENFYGKLNISRGFRSPNIAELGSNGVHEGTFRYEIGNTQLDPETSLQLDAAIGVDVEHISFEVNVFNNNIDNFVFLQKLNSVFGGDSLSEAGSEYFQAFTYIQGNANLSGAEITLDIHPHPLDWLHFENSFSFVNAIQKNATDSTKYLPFSPAPKLISEIRGDFKRVGKSVVQEQNKKATFANSYIKFQVENYFKQDHIYSAFATETATHGYTLLNIGLGTDIQSKNKTIFSFYMSANNITDVAYQNHLSRLKYAGEYSITGTTGVFNMGRNISVKLNIPINIKS